MQVCKKGRVREKNERAGKHARVQKRAGRVIGAGSEAERHRGGRGCVRVCESERGEEGQGVEGRGEQTRSARDSICSHGLVLRCYKYLM